MVVCVCAPEKDGGGSQKLTPAYKTYTYMTYICNSFSFLHWHISEMRLVKMKKVSSET